MRKKHYLNPIAVPYTRIRVVFATKRGAIRSFVVKLEYNISENTALVEEWEEVARFDHNPASEDGHDIRKEGLHMDVCDPDGTERKAAGFPDVPVNQAPRWCEEYFVQNHKRLTKRYAKLAGLNRWNVPTRR